MWVLFAFSASGAAKRAGHGKVYLNRLSGGPKCQLISQGNATPHSHTYILEIVTAMMVYACDRMGQVRALLTQKQAENAVAKGRAKWVGVNVVQFNKIFRRTEEIEITPDGPVPLPGSARPEICWLEGARRETKDISARLTGPKADETMRACWHAAREAARESSSSPSTVGYGEMAEALRLRDGERPAITGRTLTDTRPMHRLADNQKSPVAVIEGALPPLRRFTPNDVALGLSGQARKSARRRAFKELEAIWIELRACFDLPTWTTRVGGQYMDRWQLMKEIHFLMWRFWDTPKFWQYYRKIGNIISRSQSTRGSEAV
jgi:hypothetical protein